MKFVLSTLLSLATLALSQPNPLSGSSNVTLRDPAIWFNSDSKKYFVFSTGKQIPMFTSSSLNGPWSAVGSALSSCSVIPSPGSCGPWAPDVNFVNGEYVMYYAVSTSGSKISSIGLATSPSMEPGTWVDSGQVISSTNESAYNAIDPNLIDANGLKLAFGSYNQGIFQRPLSNIHTLDGSPPGAHLAGANSEPSEGGFTYKPKGSQYFFQFFSNGKTPVVNETTRPASGKEYKVLVGRSQSVSGPYLDKNGNDLTVASDPPTGTLVLGSHDNIYAPGGQSVFLDPVSGRDVMVYHYVPNNAFGGPSYLGVNYLDFSSGWPVVVDE